MPTLSQLKQEFDVEQNKKGNNFWKDENSFLEAIKKAKVVEITSSEDRSIKYRSGTTSKKELLNLIKGYQSYPKYRNEDTLESIYQGFKTNQPMDFPIVIEFKNKSRRVFSGNTRMDAAFHLGINPKVLLVKADK